MINIGIDVKQPSESCNDFNCPFHGMLSIRGRLIRGRVARSGAEKMVVVEREDLRYMPKYLRYQRTRSRVNAHLSPCLKVKDNDLITIAECRPISKNVSFVVVDTEQV